MELYFLENIDILNVILYILLIAIFLKYLKDLNSIKQIIDNLNEKIRLYEKIIDELNERDILQKKIKKAELQAMNDKISALKTKYYSSNYDNVIESIVEYHENFSLMQKDINDLKYLVSKIEKNNNDMLITNNSEIVNINDNFLTISKEIEKLKDEVNRINSKSLSLSISNILNSPIITDMKNDISKISLSLSSLTNRVSNKELQYTQNVEKLSTKLTTISNDITVKEQTLQKDIEKLSTNLTALADEIIAKEKSLQNNVEKLSTNLSTLSQEIPKSPPASPTNEDKEMSQSIVKFKYDLEAFNKRLDSYINDNEYIKEIYGRLSICEGSIYELKTGHNQLNLYVSTFNSQIIDMEQKLLVGHNGLCLDFYAFKDYVNSIEYRPKKRFNKNK